MTQMAVAFHPPDTDLEIELNASLTIRSSGGWNAVVRSPDPEAGAVPKALSGKILRRVLMERTRSPA